MVYHSLRLLGVPSNCTARRRSPRLALLPRGPAETQTPNLCPPSQSSKPVSYPALSPRPILFQNTSAKIRILSFCDRLAISACKQFSKQYLPLLNQPSAPDRRSNPLSLANFLLSLHLTVWTYSSISITPTYINVLKKRRSGFPSTESLRQRPSVSISSHPSFNPLFSVLKKTFI